MRSLIFLACLLSLWFCQPVRAEVSAPVSVCVDSDPPSPEDRGQTVLKTQNNINGVSVDIVRAAFARMGKTIEFNVNLPWQRCLYEVENQHIDFALGAYYDSERAKIYNYSIHYNTLTPQIFFLATNHLVVTQLSDLKNYRGCGIYGSSYAHYELKNENLDQGSGYESLFRKILARRCDYFVEEYEAVAGFKKGQEFLDNPLVRHLPMSGVVAPSCHLITAKNSAANSMMADLNAALDAVIKSGQAEKIWKKYMGELPFKP